MLSTQHTLTGFNYVFKKKLKFLYLKFFFPWHLSAPSDRQPEPKQACVGTALLTQAPHVHPRVLT